MKFEKKEKNLITFILYDSIHNSVFKSQILSPLLNMLKKNKTLKIHLISFEKTIPPKKLLTNFENIKRLNIFFLKRFPFFGKLSLYFAIFQLKKLFKKIHSQSIICRGPLAGWITIKVLKNLNIKAIPIKIQARGLCAQEYRFATQKLKENFIKRLLRKFIYKSLEKIEIETFKKHTENKFNIEIESVSHALSQYLVKNFKTDPCKIILATKDIPQKLSNEKKKDWRNKIRKKLEIADEKFVYCYSGSTKPWQCLPQTMDYFKKEYKKNSNNFLLLLSNDKKEIVQILKTKNLPKKSYKFLSVDPKELQKYLCACDAGFLFRDKDIINWVSRPTKMLEYIASDLKIIHNHTVSWLSDQKENQI
ncbi:hypothetical protein KAT08_03360 [Candidatus Babeliales bacterium]|nr:hypothetical protein [Candidatus Babeliales bacterium]